MSIDDMLDNLRLLYDALNDKWGDYLWLDASMLLALAQAIEELGGD